MIFLILTLIAIACIGIHRRPINDENWFRKEETDVVKGFFICWVIISHALTFVPHESSCWTTSFARVVNSGLGQLMVVPFFFISGYGVGESIRCKGISYVRSIPAKRILPILINFDVAVCCYSIWFYLTYGYVPMARFAFALIDWTSIGQPNWYVFVILCCYIFAFVAALICRRPGWLCALFVFMYSILMSFAKNDIHWHNTVMSFPAGMLFSEYKDKIELVVRNRWTVLSLALLVLFVGSFAAPWRLCGIKYNCRGIIFAILIAILMHRFCVRSIFLHWAGLNLFPLYLYHLLPMRFLPKPSASGGVIFTLFSFAITSALVLFYQRFKFTGTKVLNATATTKSISQN